VRTSPRKLVGKPCGKYGGGGLPKSGGGKTWFGRRENRMLVSRELICHVCGRLSARFRRPSRPAVDANEGAVKRPFPAKRTQTDGQRKPGGASKCIGRIDCAGGRAGEYYR